MNNTYIRYFFIPSFCLFCCTIFSCKPVKSAAPSYPIVDGIFNIENLEASEIIALKGDWVFVPNQFVPPDEDFSRYRRFEHINISWNQYSPPEPNYGYATYAVKITNFDPEGVYAVKTGNVASAFTAYFNGKEIFRSGQTGTSKKAEVFNLNSVFVSNYHDRLPGFSKPVEIAFYSTLINEKNKDILIFIISAGFLLAVAAFLFRFIYFIQKKKVLFSLECYVLILV